MYSIGFDFFYSSGITRGLRAMIPVSMLYGTPEDAAAQIAYVEKRKYPISYVELGEEHDGQRMLPEDYAALYVQWGAANHKVDPYGPPATSTITTAPETSYILPKASVSVIRGENRRGSLQFAAPGIKPRVFIFRR